MGESDGTLLTVHLYRGLTLPRPKILFNVLTVSVLLAAAMVLVQWLPVEAGMRALEEWLTAYDGWGVVAFGAIMVLVTVLLLPAWPLSVVAGAVFGLVWGAVLVSMASTVSVAVAFLLARYVARPTVARQARKYPRFEAIDRAIGEEGWKMVAMVRFDGSTSTKMIHYNSLSSFLPRRPPPQARKNNELLKCLKLEAMMERKLTPLRNPSPCRCSSLIAHQRFIL